jgi:type VI protein secretion system component VasK
LAAVRGRILCIAALAALLLAGCGGSGGGGGSRLSANAYRAKLTQIKQEAATAQANVAKGLQAKSLSELRQRLDTFANDTQRIGDEVAKLNPPQNADAANTELAAGLDETARATRAASKNVAGLHTPTEAIAYLEHSPANAKGAHQVDEALAKLKKLGYTSGS